MISNDSIILRADEFDIVDLDGEKVIMDLEKGEYFTLNVIGSVIWELISKEKSVKELIDYLISEYEVERKICEKCVISYLNELNKINLIKVI